MLRVFHFRQNDFMCWRMLTSRACSMAGAFGIDFCHIH